MTVIVTMGTQRHTFRKSERLCGKLRLKEVANSGRAVHESPLKLIGKRMPLPTASPAQIAFAVPSRYLPNAVDRNRMKRLMREAYRQHKHEHLERLKASGTQCAWLLVYQGRTVLEYEETRLRLTRALDRWMKENG